MGRTTYRANEPLSTYNARVILLELTNPDLSHSVIVPMLDAQGNKVPVVVHIGDDDGHIFATHNN